MNLNGRRESKNVEDRRRMSTAGKAGLGIGGTIIVALIALIMGGDPSEVLQNANLSSVPATETEYQPTAEEQELAKFASQILAGTEDVWTAEFKKMGRTYKAPKLVLFKSQVQSGCGGASASSGPF